MSGSRYSIGALSHETGCKVPTIRYYERIKLLPEPPRTEGKQRRYSKTHLDRLRFICHARELGFSIESIRQLLLLGTDVPEKSKECCYNPNPAEGSSCNVEISHNADEIAKQHLAEIEGKISRLSGLRDELKSMINACESGHSHSCRVIEVLSNHQLCHSDHR
ncbi:helix-turn-helix domain-containing protein [Motiliproteus sp. MSK22-1]|uniref:MerR family transcriptional regulator n=1 Tax=Motiliproteus sp. MSK22-1 TaxID=1897630 RepID=UPI0009782EC5|nr:helix-turn-helix domain-containing protein [Motiliproteus sp. MSK22-1]OMH33289.1 hypothetical protein BGP75_13680 [Motiliproteus sp. MSK22-1]